MFELNDQVALVTGAARGIGRRVAELLSQAGAQVVLTDFADWDETLTQLEDGMFATRLDVTDPERVKAVVGLVTERLGRIDILVNNAGIVRDNLLMRMKAEEWRSVLSTNLDGVFYLTKEVISKMMRNRYGRVVNISSVVGVMGNAGQVNYSASKAGVIGFTKSLAREVSSRGITVNAVAPGYIQTKMTDELNEKARQELISLIPLGRIGLVDDIANGVLFLASEEAGYITGHVLNINGGMYM